MNKIKIFIKACYFDFIDRKPMVGFVYINKSTGEKIRISNVSGKMVYMWSRELAIMSLIELFNFWMMYELDIKYNRYKINDLGIKNS